MARSHALIKTAVWNAGSDFRQLTLDAQWAFEMLLSQPQITNCGVLLYRPDKWVRLASDLTYIRLLQAFAELRLRLFIVVDEDTAELLVRTFIKHDRVWRQPNLVKNARTEYATIESDLIREVLAHQYPWLIDNTDPKDAEKLEAVIPLDEPLTKALREGVPEGLQEPLWEPLSEKGLSEGVSEPPYARATRTTPPLPLPRREPPKGSLSNGRSGNEGAPAAAQQAAPPAHASTNGQPTAAFNRARAFIERVGREYPSWPVLADELHATTALGKPHFPDLTDSDFEKLRALHAELLDPEPDTQP